MTTTALKLTTLAIVAFTLSAGPALAAGTDTPPPSSDSDKSKSKKKGQKSFLDGYRKAYASIYQDHDYASGISQLKALKQNGHADVANLI